MFQSALLTAIVLLQPGSTVDHGISLYEMGDIPGAIIHLEALLREGSLSLDEELRAWNRLGSAYYAMGSMDKAREAYSRLLVLDTHYDLGPRANPRLRDLLAHVRENTMASAMVRSNPTGALVTMDDDLLGVTPLLIDGLVGGRSYSISVYQVGFGTESFSLTAQPGHSHILDFTLESPPDALASSSEGTGPGSGEPETGTSGTGGYQSTELPEGSSGTQASSSSGGSAGAPQSTDELIAALTQGGRGIDMTSIAGSGSLQRESSQSATEFAGSTSSMVGLAQSGIPIRAEEVFNHIMVFSDTGGSPEGLSQGSSYSSRSGGEIMEVLTGKQEQIRYIYSKHLRSDPLLSGSVEVEMVIQPSGRVTDVAILRSSMYNQAFELELSRAISTWRFGSVDENEGPLVLQLPFNFQ